MHNIMIVLAISNGEKACTKTIEKLSNIIGHWGVCLSEHFVIFKVDKIIDTFGKHTYGACT